ncbi:thioesterase family protein [Telluribacter sp. SYSU D00476]|uniref:acyl-CoA thioesterase n=1 Tax=Telluribacter sp. SYSU D00476 TaxID=2811430 RepID=UPI001FF3834D|nr:thioesterase family protein [Telluribacter sp. SYSU D00476]
MKLETFQTTIIWAQIDGNMHLRHSAYADIAAHARVQILNQIGLDHKTFTSLQLGPILFREELIYLREVVLNETVSVETTLTHSTADASRWSFRHELYRSDGVKAAVVNVDGAWLDLTKRKLTIPPDNVVAQLLGLPKSEDYKQTDVPGKAQ